MARIGVRLPARFDDAGSYLADARALDTAGVDSFWVEPGGDDPWLLLAGIAAVTGRARLVAPIISAEDRRSVDARIATLARLSRGRAALTVSGSVATKAAEVAAVLACARRAGPAPVFVEMGPRAVSLPADGAVCALDKVQIDRARAGASSAYEVWTPITFVDLDQWRVALRHCDELGVTGIIVPADPRLLDVLRNGDQEDDRSDLLLAQG